MVVGRVESLGLGKGVDDALTRAQAYIEAGADAIMIHSAAKVPDEILTFCRRVSGARPAHADQSRYRAGIQRDDRNGARGGGWVRVVIYANDLLRSAYPSMVKTARSILQSGGAREADEFRMPISEVLALIPAAS